MVGQEIIQQHNKITVRNVKAMPIERFRFVTCSAQSSVAKYRYGDNNGVKNEKPPVKSSTTEEEIR